MRSLEVLDGDKEDGPPALSGGNRNAHTGAGHEGAGGAVVVEPEGPAIGMERGGDEGCSEQESSDAHRGHPDRGGLAPVCRRSRDSARGSPDFHQTSHQTSDQFFPGVFHRICLRFKPLTATAIRPSSLVPAKSTLTGSISFSYTAFHPMT